MYHYFLDTQYIETLIIPTMNEKKQYVSLFLELVKVFDVDHIIYETPKHGSLIRRLLIWTSIHTNCIFFLISYRIWRLKTTCLTSGPLLNNPFINKLCPTVLLTIYFEVDRLGDVLPDPVACRTRVLSLIPSVYRHTLHIIPKRFRNSLIISCNHIMYGKNNQTGKALRFHVAKLNIYYK